MRWVVQVSPIGGAAPSKEHGVEASGWREALGKVRGDAALGEGTVVDLIPGGARVVDAARRVRYLITAGMPASPGTGKPGSVPPSVAVPRPGSVPPSAAAARPAGARLEEADTGSGEAAGEASIAVPQTPEHWLLTQRAEAPTAATPITYRECAYAVQPGTPLDAVELLLWVRFKDVCSEIAHAPPGKYVQLAVFDHSFQGRPLRPPLATLAWKDWRGDPVLHFPLTRPLTQPPAPLSMPPPGYARRGPSRRAADEIISDLFEALALLPQQSDAGVGAALVLESVARALPCAGAFVHFFDLNTNEFVVSQAKGPQAERVLGVRTSQKESPFAALAKREGARCLDASFDTQYLSARRWEVLEVRPHFALCGLIVRQRRLLGAIELANPTDGAPFTESEARAIDYVCERLGEFLADRPLEFGAVVISDG
jgi:hypothetical protein